MNDETKRASGMKRAPAAAAKASQPSGFRVHPDHISLRLGMRRAPRLPDPDEPKITVIIRRGCVHIPDPSAPKIHAGYCVVEGRDVALTQCTWHYPSSPVNPGRLQNI